MTDEPHSTFDKTSGDLTNFWYIAARSKELRKKPIQRRIFSQNIALFRDSDNKPAALLDRCAHRNIALSQGTGHTQRGWHSFPNQ